MVQEKRLAGAVTQRQVIQEMGAGVVADIMKECRRQENAPFIRRDPRLPGLRIVVVRVGQEAEQQLARQMVGADAVPPIACA